MARSSRSRSTKGEMDVRNEEIIRCIKAEHPVSVRGVFYRVMSAGLVPKTEEGYRQIVRALTNLRSSGAVPHEWIVDGQRAISRPDSWTDLSEVLDYYSAHYRRSLWQDQDCEVLVFSEKMALSGVLEPVTASPLSADRSLSLSPSLTRRVIGQRALIPCFETSATKNDTAAPTRHATATAVQMCRPRWLLSRGAAHCPTRCWSPAASEPRRWLGRPSRS